MKKLFFVVRYLEHLLNKHNYYRSKTEIVDAIHRQQMSLFVERYGKVQDYQPGRPVPRVAYQMTQKVSDDLKPFLKFQSYKATGAVDPELPITAGEIALPGDFVHPTSLRTTGAVSDVDLVDDNTLTARLNSLIRTPTSKNPVAEILANGYRLYTTTDIAAPGGVTAATLKYLSQPVRPLYAQTTGALLTIDVTNGGSGYTAPPAVGITGGNGSASTATAVLTADVVTSIVIVSAGSGYTTLPTITLTGDGTGATAVATLSEESVYDDANTVDLLWGEQCLNEIIFRSAADLGLQLKDASVINYSLGLKTQGS